MTIISVIDETGSEFDDGGTGASFWTAGDKRTGDELETVETALRFCLVLGGAFLGSTDGAWEIRRSTGSEFSVL